MKIHVKIFLISAFLLSAKFLSAQENAKDLFLKSTELLPKENMELAMAIDVTDAKGQLKAKELTVLMATFGEEEKTKVIWQKPERAKGTTIIITELPGQIGEIEVFTPSNGKTRKLKATEANMNLMGAEFNLTSFAKYDPKELNYKLLTDTTISNQPCHRIEVSGNANKDHSRAVLTIRKDSNYIILVTRYDEKNKVISQTQLSNYKELTGNTNKVYPMKVVTKDYKNSKDIVIRISGVTAKKDLTKSDFTL